MSIYEALYRGLNVGLDIELDIELDDALGDAYYEFTYWIFEEPNLDFDEAIGSAFRINLENRS